MHLDVVDLKSFYYRTKLGRTVKSTLQNWIADHWTDTEGQTVVGFGFACPFLRPFLGSARRVISLMPGQQGVMPWPQGLPNVSCLVEETQWPIAAGTADKVLVAHGLETCDSPSQLLDEIWRILAPGGTVLFIVPNRAGLWARRDRTPFGFGRPGVAERFGQRFGVGLGAGALIVEATKQIYVMPKGGAVEAISRPLEVLEGLTRPIPKPATGRDYPKLIWPKD